MSRVALLEGGQEKVKYEDVSVKERGYWRLFKENVFSGIAVALVSVPLSTALAIAAGAKPMMGLTAAIYGPII